MDRHDIALDGTAFHIPKVDNITFSALALVSKAAPYSPHREQSVDGDNIGFTITDTISGRRLF